MRTRNGSVFHAIAVSTMLAVAVATPAAAQSPPVHFPPATPESQGMSAEALAELVEVVRDFASRDLFVGAELVIIKNRACVLQETFGRSNRENDTVWAANTICNIRSMSKPFTGAAAQMLIDQGKLSLDDPVAKYIPAFDTDTHRGITVEHLITHRSGLPLTALTGRIDEFASLHDLAASLADRELRFEPGTQFWYSDAGSDTLGAIVEVVSGVTLDAFVTEHLLEPLGMSDSFYVFTDDESLWSRVATPYMGAANTWQPFWSPDDGALYPFAWGSQTIYSTPIDYAKFLCMWMDDGLAADGTRILSSEAVERTLTPASPMQMLGSDARFPTDFSGLEVYYGQMSVLHVPTDDPTGSEPVIIGHSGSDGTIAWAWPEHDLMILFFTQSRGGMAVLRLEEHVDRLILHPERHAAEDINVPEDLQPYLGTYMANFGSFENEPFEVRYRDDKLVLDVPSQMVFELLEPNDEGHFAFAIAPEQVFIAFERDDNGEVNLLKMHQGRMVYDVPREGTPLAIEQAKKPIVDVDAVQRFVGTYDDPTSDAVVNVFLEGETFCIQSSAGGPPVHMRSIDADNTFELRQAPGILIRFNVDPDGGVVSLTRIAGDNEFEMPRIAEKGEPDAGFITLFDGTSLDGWDGNADHWTVEDGCIVGRSTAASPVGRNTFLIWEGGDVGDFELRAEVQLLGNNNSGIQYRAQVHDTHRATGYQCDIHPNPPYNGMLYEEGGRGIVATQGSRMRIAADGTRSELQPAVEPIDFPLNEWRTITIIARGNRLEHRIDDHVTVVVEDFQQDKHALSGALALQLHAGSPYEVRFRNVRLKHLVTE